MSKASTNSERTKKKLILEFRFPDFKENWIKTKLSKHIDLLSGYAFQSIYFSENGQKLLTPKNFTKNGVANFNSENTKYTTEKFDEKYLCNEGDLLLLLTDLTSSCELLGKPVMLKKEEGKVLLNQRIVKVTFKGNIDGKFLLQYFLSDLYHKRIKNTASGSTVRHSSNKIILDTELFYPSKPKEQQKIASCLSSLDEVIAAHSQKLDALKEHKKGLMQNLFPQEGETVPKYRFPECKEKWIKTKLSKHIDLLSGYAFQSIYFSENGQKLLTPKNFTKDGVANFNSENTKYTTEKFDEKYLCNEGDLLLLLTDLTSSCELLGKPVMLKKEEGKVLLNQRIVKVTFKGNIDGKFLLQYFLSDLYHKRIKNTASGSTVRHSSNKIILDTELFYPSNPKEQQKIASCLSSVDALITAQAEKIEQLNLHKKGLLQGLFPKRNN